MNKFLDECEYLKITCLRLPILLYDMLMLKDYLFEVTNTLI